MPSLNSPLRIARAPWLALCVLTALWGLGCGKPTSSSEPDPGWQALFEEQKKEIKRLEEENARLRANCRDSEPFLEEEPLTPEASAPAGAEASSSSPASPGLEIKSLAGEITVAAGSRSQIQIRGEIANEGPADKLAATFQAISVEGQILQEWSWVKDLPAGGGSISESRVVTGRPTRLRLTIRTQGSQPVRREISILDRSPFVPGSRAAAPARSGGKLVVLNGPSIRYVTPDEVGVDGKLWNPSTSETVTRSVTVRLLRGGVVIEEQTIEVEDLAPGSEKDLAVTFRGDGSGGPYTADVVFQ